ncbi:MAG: GNAT family N-acetyltransferase [Bacillota bacterium]
MDWQQLRFGVEIEFTDREPAAVERLPGWSWHPSDRQFDDRGAESGGEFQSPPITWAERGQIGQMLERLRAAGATANWSCGLHVHVSIEPWGQGMVDRLLEAAISCQEGLRTLLQTPPHRMLFCPPVTPAMRERFRERPERRSLVYRGRPQSHRCGINAAAWFDNGTVEIRYANASLEAEPVLRTVELCLRFVAAVGEGRALPAEPAALAEALGAPAGGYPPPSPPPLWHRERLWLEEALLPALTPRVEERVPGGEILFIRPAPGGMLVAVESEGSRLTYFRLQAGPEGFRFGQTAAGEVLSVRRAVPEEAPTMQALLHAAYAPNLAAGFNFTAATVGLEELRELIREQECYLLWAGPALVGTITLWDDGSIGRFGIEPGRKGQGLGRWLLAFAEDLARMKGWARVELDTPVSHPWLPDFYRRCGYEPVRTVHWEGKRYDSVVMEKEL